MRLLKYLISILIILSGYQSHAGNLPDFAKPLRINYDSIVSPDPRIKIDPEEISFTSVSTGATSTEVMTIINIGKGLLHIGQIKISGNDFKIDKDGCSGNKLKQNSSCMIRVLFEPLKLGSKREILTIPSNDSQNNNTRVSLTGEANYGFGVF